MGHIVSIIAEASEQRPRYPKCDFTQLAKIQLGDAYERASWTKDRIKLERRRKRWRLKKIWDSRVEDFALSRALFENSKLAWECTDIVGQGTFGTVGLWQKFDSGGNAIDSLAIKEIEANPEVEMARCKNYKVPLEALSMHEFRNTWSIPQLRQLAYLHNNRGFSRWRMYQEYCAKGDLRNMIKSYQEFNKRWPDHYQTIPEIYIWYVFFGLAKAVLAMDTPGFNQILPEYQPIGHRYILHLDIKDANVLLADAFNHRLLSAFPTVKLCDWGVAIFTSKTDKRNSTMSKKCGTPVWDPPEQCFENKLCEHWTRNPHGHFRDSNRARRNDIDTPYTISHPLWQIAAITYGMMTLDKDNEQLCTRLRKCNTPRAEQEIRHRDMRFHEWRGINQDTYSQHLLSLVGDCLSFDPRKRPSPQELVERVKTGLRDVAMVMEAKGHIRPVFYGPNAVAEMEDFVQPRKKKGSDPYHVQERRRERPMKDDGKADKPRFGFRF